MDDVAFPRRFCARQPTLAQFSVTGVMQNPMLELHDGSGSLIITNDNWKDTQQAEIAATQLAPPADAEAAILATLRPGAYTAIQTGAGGGTGVGLIEVYGCESARRLEADQYFHTRPGAGRQ